MSTEEKDRRIAELEQALVDRDDQYAQEIAALNEQLAAAKSDPTEIPGSLEIKVESAKGQKATVKIGFVNGMKTVAFAGNRTSTAALLKRANGEELTPEELRANPALGKTKPEVVKETLTKWYTKGAAIFKVLPVLFLLLLCGSVLQAQTPTYNSNTVGGGRYFSNTPTTIDTLTAADTLIIYPSFKNTDLGDYVWELHSYVKSIASTPTVTIYIEESMFEDPAQAYWVRTDTIALASSLTNGTSKQNISSGDIKGTRWRAFIVSSGSGAKAQFLHRGRIRKKTVNTP